VLLSTDLDEILTLSDKVAVMFNGRIAGLFDNCESLNKKIIGQYMVGIKNGEADNLDARKN
jgi:ABC-type uncharacterized transport system ATPase subunit